MPGFIGKSRGTSNAQMGACVGKKAAYIITYSRFTKQTQFG
jgi:hypothetical protein